MRAAARKAVVLVNMLESPTVIFLHPKALGIPAAAIPKLKKALELDDAAQVKALDALAKELNLKTTGKAMADKLSKL